LIRIANFVKILKTDGGINVNFYEQSKQVAITNIELSDLQPLIGNPSPLIASIFTEKERND